MNRCSLIRASYRSNIKDELDCSTKRPSSHRLQRDCQHQVIACCTSAHITRRMPRSDALQRGGGSSASAAPARPGLLCNAELCGRRGEAVADLCVRQTKIAGSSVLRVKGVLEIDTGYKALFEPADMD